MSCSENGNFAVIAYNEWNLSQNFTSARINTITSFVLKSDFQTRFTMSSGFFALLTPERHAIKVENRTGLCIGQRLTHFPAFTKSCEVQRCKK